MYSNKAILKWVSGILMVAFFLGNTINLFAEETVDISTTATQENVERVKTLAGQLATANANIDRTTGQFTWDLERKNRSWTYYNGIMMDAFLMMEERLGENYSSYVNRFYDANISTQLAQKGDKYGYVNDRKAGGADNHYRIEELDSIPPARALFDLLKGSTATANQKSKYKTLFRFIYNLMERDYKAAHTYTSGSQSMELYGVFENAGGNFRHKFANPYGNPLSAWITYPIALDGLYMAQPFYMEIANALTAESPLLTVTDLGLSNTNAETIANKIYGEVYNRMKWIGDNLYDPSTKLYNHGYNMSASRTNGVCWLRAVGWYAAALADVIDLFPDSDSYAVMKNELIRIETQLFDGMIAEQDPSGLWLNVLKQNPSDGNKLETSGSALMAYAMMKSYVNGHVGDVYGEAGLKAFNGIVSENRGYVYTGTDGNLTLGSIYKSASVFDTASSYMNTSYYVDKEAKGIGPLMMAACYAEAAVEMYHPQTELEWIKPASKEKLVYDGTKQELVTAGETEHGTIVYALGEDESTAPEDEKWQEEIPAGTDAVTYYVWYKVTGAEGYNDVLPACIPVTISKKSLTITADSAEQSYTGNALTKNTYKSDGLADPDEIVSLTITGSRTDVGESNNVPSDVEIKRKTEETDPSISQSTTGTPESSDVSENYVITYVNGKLKVTKASNSVSVSIEGWTYGDTAKSPTATASFGTPVISYSKDQNGTFTSAVPTNAGIWYVKAEVTGTSNYDGATATTSFTIAPKVVSIQAIEANKTYGEADPGLTYTSEGLVNNDAITGNLARAEGENVGQYAINQGTLSAGDNYNINFTGAYFTIEAKEIGLTWGNTSFTYDGNNYLPTATATNLVGNDVCAVTVEGEQKNAGTHTATAIGLSNNNYKLPANVTQSFTIEKAAASCTPPTAKENLVYSGQAQDLIEQGSTQDGTMQYALGDKDGTEPTSGWASDIPKATNAGTYYVWYKLQGDSNHKDLQPEKILAQIAKKPITVSRITAKDRPYDGTTEVTLDFSTAVLDGKIDTDDLSVTATGAFEDANVEDNKTVTISGITLDGSGKDNYQLAEQGQQESTTASITPKVLDVTKAPEAVANLVYNSTSQTLVKAGEAEGGTLQYSLAENGTFSAELPSATEPGTYTVYYKAAASDANHADSEVQGPISVTIAKAPGSILYETASITKIFGDPAFTNELTHIGDGSVTYTSSNSGIVTVDPGTGKVSIIGTGEATITATVADSDHYTYAEKTAQYTLNVEKKGMTVNAEGYTGSYDGSAHSITVTVTEPADGYTIRYGTEEGKYDLDSNSAITDVRDSKTVYFQVTAPNYTDYTGYAAVTISKAEQVAPVAPTAESVSANSVTLNAATGYQYSMDGSNWQDNPMFSGLTKNTEYTFYQRIAEDDNHNASPSSSGQKISTSDHVHEWSYTASQDSITATCTDTDGQHGGNTTATVRIVAPAHKTYGDGLSEQATITGSIDGVADPAIVYRKGSEILPAAPNDAGNYSAIITIEDMTAEAAYIIQQKPVKITGLSAENKEYDGTTAATITGTPQLEEVKKTGLLGLFSTPVTGGAVENGDEVNVDYGTASFETPDAGNNKPVTFIGFTLSGSSSGNYLLMEQPSGKASITKKTVTINAKDQSIKEGEEINKSLDQVTVDGLLAGHQLSGITLTADGNQGNQVVKPSGARITDASGADVTGNYNVTYVNGTLTVIKRISHTVTFKVVNGSWANGGNADITVPLSGFEGDMLTLPADQIPSAGGNPAAGYQAGSWDVTPSAGTVITGDTTYTYTYAKQPETITITYDTNGGEGSYGPSTADANGSVTLPGAPSREGYTFAGWKLDGVTYQPGQTITVSKSGTATVVWTPVSQASSPSDLIPDNTLTVKGLQQGDIVYFYKVLEFNADANGSDNGVIGAGGWAVNEKFASILTTVEDVESVLGLCVDAKGIDHNLAGRLGSCAVNTPELQATANADGIAKVETGVTPGLWIGIVKPANPGIIYNPVFLGADYDTDNDSNVLVIPIEKSYSDNAMVKVDKITLTKTAKDAVSVDDNDKETVAVGDIITFTIATQIPVYASNYTKPVFMITDKLSEGLAFDNAFSVAVTANEERLAADRYNLQVNADGSGFTLSFTDQYLKNIIGATTAVKLEYKATVTSSAVSSVNPEDNTVTLNYSTEPSDQEGHGILKDRTNHYTFDIDANLFGEDSYGATEVVKVGVDAQGNEIKESRQLSNGSWVGALQGAKFRLYKNDGTTPYTNKYITANTVFISDVDGRLKQMDGQTVTEYGIRGLDAGEYKLVETQAPAGYVKLQDAVSIKIEAKTREVTYEDDGTLYKADELESYTVKIGGKETANYTMTNTAINTSHVDPAEDPKPNKGDKVGQYGFIKGDEIGTSAADGKLINTQGAELPSTGGSGVTLFYAIGLIMTMGAGWLLMRKKSLAG